MDISAIIMNKNKKKEKKFLYFIMISLISINQVIYWFFYQIGLSELAPHILHCVCVCSSNTMSDQGFYYYYTFIIYADLRMPGGVDLGALPSHSTPYPSFSIRFDERFQFLFIIISFKISSHNLKFTELQAVYSHIHAASKSSACFESILSLNTPGQTRPYPIPPIFTR